MSAELGLDDAETIGFIGSFYDYESLDDLIAAFDPGALRDTPLDPRQRVGPQRAPIAHVAHQPHCPRVRHRYRRGVVWLHRALV